MNWPHSSSVGRRRRVGSRDRGANRSKPSEVQPPGSPWQKRICRRQRQLRVAAVLDCIALASGQLATDERASTCEIADVEVAGTVLLSGSALDPVDCRLRCCGTQHCGGWAFEKRGMFAAPGACTLVYAGEATLVESGERTFTSGIRDEGDMRDCCRGAFSYNARALAAEAASKLLAKRAAGKGRCDSSTRWLEQPMLEMASCAFLRQGYDLLLEMPLDGVGLSRVRSIQANDKFGDEIYGKEGIASGARGLCQQAAKLVGVLSNLRQLEVAPPWVMLGGVDLACLDWKKVFDAGWGRTVFGAMWDLVEEGRRLALGYPREKDPSVWAKQVDEYLRHINSPISADVLERLPDKYLQDFVAVHETVKELYQKALRGRVDSNIVEEVSTAYARFREVADLLLEMSFSSMNVIILFQEIWVHLERLASFYEADRLEQSSVGVSSTAPLPLPAHELPSLCRSGAVEKVGGTRPSLPSLIRDDGAVVAVLGAFVHDITPEIEGSGRHELLVHVFAEAPLEEYRAQLRKRHWTWESGNAKSSPGNWMCLTRAESHWWRASCAFEGHAGHVEVEGFLFSMHSYSLRVKCLIPSQFVLAEKTKVVLKLRDDTGWHSQLPFNVCREKNRTVHNVTVCTKPLFDAPDLLKDDAHLVQDWIAYHGLLGIDHFQIYDTDSSFGPALEGHGPTSVTYVPRFPELISPNMRVLAAEGYHGCLVSQSYDHCFFSNAQTSNWLLHLHAPDSYIHTEDPTLRQKAGLQEWLQEEDDEGNFHKQLCAVSLRSTWFGGVAHGPATAPLFARYLWRDEPLYGWNRSELLMKTKYTLYLGGHKPYCRHRTLTFVAPAEQWRMNHYVNMDRSRCDNCSLADDSAMWAAESVMRARVVAIPAKISDMVPPGLAATRNTHSSSADVGSTDLIRAATEPVGNTALAPVVKPIRSITEQRTARSVSFRQTTPLDLPNVADLDAKRVDSVLSLDDCRQLQSAMLEGRWSLTDDIFEMALDDEDASRHLHSGPEVQLAAQPLLSAVRLLAHELEELSGPLAVHARAVGLMHQAQVELKPNGEGWRFLYFTQELNMSGSADNMFLVGGESVMKLANGQHALTVLPQENVGYLVPATWSVTSQGPPRDAAHQLGIIIIVDLVAHGGTSQDTGRVLSESAVLESHSEPRFLTPASLAFKGVAWLSHIHVFADVLPKNTFKQLLESIRAGPWTWEGKLGTTFRQAVDDTQSVHLDPRVSSAVAPLLDAAAALAEEKTGFPITYYHSYATYNQLGQSSPLHRDVGEGPRRLWTFIFYLDVPVTMQRELLFFTDDLSHVGTLLPEPNSAILYPALLQHSDRSSARSNVVATAGSRGSVAIEVRLAACSNKDHGVDRSGVEVELCYA